MALKLRAELSLCGTRAKLFVLLGGENHIGQSRFTYKCIDNTGSISFTLPMKLGFICDIPATQWPIVKEAVLAYNEQQREAVRRKKEDEERYSGGKYAWLNEAAHKWNVGVYDRLHDGAVYSAGGYIARI